jgi:hypothetical protein
MCRITTVVSTQFVPRTCYARLCAESFFVIASKTHRWRINASLSGASEQSASFWGSGSPKLEAAGLMKIHNVLHIDVLSRETKVYVIPHPLSVMTRTLGVQVQVWTRLFLSTTKIHNFFNIHLLSPSVMTRTLGVQLQVWTRLFLSTMKIHNFFNIHLLSPYRVTEAYTTLHL